MLEEVECSLYTDKHGEVDRLTRAREKQSQRLDE